MISIGELPVSDTKPKDNLLEKLKKLITHLESGDDQQALVLLDELSSGRDSYLFLELGKLTRKLHDSLTNFQLDTRLIGLANNDIPDAKERLNYVISMTEQSANRTLGAVEQSIAILDDLQDQAVQENQNWGRFMRKELSIDEFRELTRGVTRLLETAGAQNLTVRNNLNEVLMAQEFQDLTSQIIRKVIRLVEELEVNMITLIKISGGLDKTPGAGPEASGDLSGPAVPGVSTSKASLSSQDEVDDLLSSLGF